MAENRRNRRDSRSRNKQKNRMGIPPKKELLKRHAEYIESAKKQAWDRFDLDPLPIGIPEEHEPPQTHSFEWENMPVSLKVEQKLAKIVVRKGEFGWLEDERVQEIGEIVDDLDMTLDQALSLRSALLNKKQYTRMVDYNLEVKCCLDYTKKDWELLSYQNVMTFLQ